MNSKSGDCESASEWGNRALSNPASSHLLALHQGGGWPERFCLWRLYQSAGMPVEAEALYRSMQAFPGAYLEQRDSRRQLLEWAPRLVREKVWGLGLAQRALSYSLVSQDDLDLVRRIATDLLEAYPTDVNLHYLIGQVYLRQGKPEEAARWLDDASRLAPGQSSACTSGDNGDKASAVNNEDLLYFDSFDSGLTVWDMFQGWVGGETFRPALYLFSYDSRNRVEGQASLRLSGIWTSSDQGRQPARTAMMVRLPSFSDGLIKVQFYYQTHDLPDGGAEFWLVQSDAPFVRISLPATHGCWVRYEQVIDWRSGPRPYAFVHITGMGDYWIDSLSISGHAAQ